MRRLWLSLFRNRLPRHKVPRAVCSLDARVGLAGLHLSPFLDVPLVCNLRLRLTRYEAESPVGAPLPRIECTIGSLDAGVPGPFSPNKARVGLGRLQVSRLQVPGIFGAFDTGVGFGTTQTILRCSASAGQDNES
ncbi:hypothetical protein CGCF413_v006336 [Colletotrichum fructicola]|nr:hypothetical protein CGCF413_v006336 [Colletotrichum fructicola]